MSAYGAIQNPNVDAPALPSTFWPLRPISWDPRSYLTIHHLRLCTTRPLPGLVEHLRAVFAKEVADGTTYPQEDDMTQETFESYFFACDVFVGIVGGKAWSGSDVLEREVGLGIDEAREGRKWEECVAGYYYVKPNYPGRSSHICNAGFVVPPNHRGGGYGSVMAKSYVHYAPKLGYQASVFNLVFVNNTASIKLWEKLNFQKVGVIPRAGRLRRNDGLGDHYVDAWVFYKSFVDNVGGSGLSNKVQLDRCC